MPWDGWHYTNLPSNADLSTDCRSLDARATEAAKMVSTCAATDNRRSTSDTIRTEAL